MEGGKDSGAEEGEVAGLSSADVLSNLIDEVLREPDHKVRQELVDKALGLASRNEDPVSPEVVIDAFYHGWRQRMRQQQELDGPDDQTVL